MTKCSRKKECYSHIDNAYDVVISMVKAFGKKR